MNAMMNALHDLFRTATTRFPNLSSDYHNPKTHGFDDGDTDEPCTIGSMMLSYGAVRRQHDLPFLEGIRFGPFPYPKTSTDFIQALLSALGAKVSKKWSRKLAERVMMLNDGLMSSNGKWERRAEPELALALFKEQLEAKLAEHLKPEPVQLFSNTAPAPTQTSQHAEFACA